MNGTIYTTTTGQQGETSLVQLALAQEQPIIGAQLKFEDTLWNSGLSSLACSPSDQLFALGARRYEAPYNLYTVNPSNGVMGLLRKWDVLKITIPRPA